MMAKTDGADPAAKIAAPARVAAFRTGLSAETRAAAFLMAKGYRILAKRLRTPYGEIYIVARRRNLLAIRRAKAPFQDAIAFCPQKNEIARPHICTPRTLATRISS